jgi:hypothetical protein
MMRKYLALLISILTLTGTIQARAENAATEPAKPVCYSQDDLYRDLKYGHCDLFVPGSKNENISPVCPELQDVLKHDPASLVISFYDKANEGLFLAQALNCSGTIHFIKKNIHFSSVETSGVLARYAKKCSVEGIIYARLFGAEDKKDARYQQKPSEIIQKKLDELKVKMAVETDGTQTTALKKSFDECTKAMASLAQPKIRLEDIRGLKVPTEVKVVFLKQADKSGLGDDSVQRTISSVPAAALALPPAASASQNP